MKSGKDLYGFGSIVLFGLLLVLVACGKMDSTYHQFIKNGEPVYTGKALSLQAFSGKNRAKLTWLISDPSVAKCKIVWVRPDGVSDSSEIIVNKTANVDSIQTVIGNLPEASYDFYVSTYDDLGHTSVKSAIEGVKVYGDFYRSGLHNRSYESFQMINDSLVSVWQQPDTATGINITTELRYTDTLGQTEAIYLLPKDDTLILSNWQVGTQVYYTSSYKPSNTAIDTFTVLRPDSIKEIDIEVATLTLTSQREGSISGYGPSNLADGNVNTKFFLSDFYGNWIEYEFNIPMVINTYKLISADDSPQRDPFEWELLGSKDGSQWEVLDSRDKQIFNERLQSIQYDFNNIVPYKFYRLNIISVVGGNGGMFQLAGWSLARKM
jgi:hypothetical protein